MAKIEKITTTPIYKCDNCYYEGESVNAFYEFVMVDDSTYYFCGMECLKNYVNISKYLSTVIKKITTTPIYKCDNWYYSRESVNLFYEFVMVDDSTYYFCGMECLKNYVNISKYLSTVIKKII